MELLFGYTDVGTSGMKIGMRASYHVKLLGVLNGGPVEQEIEPVLRGVGRVADLNGTTAPQVAALIRSSQDAVLCEHGGLKILIRPSASELAIVVCSAEQRPNRPSALSSELQEEAIRLCGLIARALR